MARQGGFPDVDAYLAFLETGGREASSQVQQLLRDLSVSVSGFFRDPGVFEALQEQVFPDLCRSRGDGPLRVWSAACARGQEAYTLAIALWRFTRSRGLVHRAAVLGTDVDEAALIHARRGSYPRRMLEGVPKPILEEAFVPEPGGALRVRPEIRRLVRFQRADLLDSGSHPEGVDLIACRNLLIYLQRNVQEDLILALRRALRPGGYLVLGATETVLGRPWALLEHVNPTRRIYRRPPADQESDGPSRGARGAQFGTCPEGHNAMSPEKRATQKRL
jgi:chemotaxis methyl-accepting protein methylase